jgi:hypothetical protein
MSSLPLRRSCTLCLNLFILNDNNTESLYVNEQYALRVGRSQQLRPILTIEHKILDMVRRSETLAFQETMTPYWICDTVIYGCSLSYRLLYLVSFPRNGGSPCD